MAHEIVGGQIAWAGREPWHGLGTQMDYSQSGDEFLKAAGLDWEITTHQMFTEIDGERVEVPNKFAFIRSSDKKVMTVASGSWKPLQNATAIKFMQDYVDAGGAQMEVVGALRDGQVIWGLARLNHQYEVRPGDKSVGYLLIRSPHQVGSSIQVSTTTVRVVCANTMTLSDSNRELHYRQSHLREFDIDAAKDMVARAHESLSKAEVRGKVLDAQKISIEDAVRKVIVPVFAPEIAKDSDVMDKIMEDQVMPLKIRMILESIENGPGAIPDTAWGVLNGITHYLDHVHGRTQAVRWANAAGGWGATKKSEAEKVLLELAA